MEPVPVSTSPSQSVSKWPRQAGFFSSMASPLPKPATPSQWKDYFLTSRNKPLSYRLADNIKAGITTALVNVPLSVSLSLAGGGTPLQGMITAVWAGLVTAVAGGSQFNVVGPTGALSGMLAVISSRHGSAMLPILALHSAFVLLIFFFLRLDKYLRFVSTAVGHGFSVGVAIIILVSQLGGGFGLQNLPPADGVTGKLVEIVAHLPQAALPDTAFFLFQVATLFLLIRKWPAVPWMILFTVTGIAVGSTAPAGTFVLLSSKYPNLRMALFNVPPLPFINVPADCLPSAIARSTALMMPGTTQCELMHHYFDGDILFYAVAVAVVALLETLISAKIGNDMVKSDEDAELLRRTFSTKRELFALALANAVSGLCGGIPATAALARTALNIRSGAFSRVSCFVGTVSVALIAFVFLPSFEFIPVSTVSALLAIAAYRMVDWHEIEHILRCDSESMSILVLTSLCCVTLDTFIGLAIGALVSICLHWKQISCYAITVTHRQVASPNASLTTAPGDANPRLPESVQDTVLTTVAVGGVVVFANVDEVDALLDRTVLMTEEIAATDTLRHFLLIDFHRCHHLDFDGIQLFTRWSAKLRSPGTPFSGVRFTNAFHLRLALSAAPDVLEDMREEEEEQQREFVVEDIYTRPE